jgi:peptidoglycan/LPS O-acetylase OafA/YrhL
MTLLERFKASSFRGPGFDQIRLGAAIIVLFHHCSGVNGNDVRLDPLFHFSYGYIHFGFLAVAIFFAISGFLVTPSLLRSGNIIDFATRRILRIFPGLICVVFVTMLVLGPVLTILPLAEYFTDFQFYRYAKNIVTLTVDHLPGVTSGDGHPIDVNGSLWTLHFEVLSYAALAVTSILGILHRRSLFLALFLISYGTNIVLGLDPAFSALLPARFVTFMSLFVYFMTGAMLFVYADHIPYSPILAIGILALAVVTMPFGLGALFVPVCLSYLMVFLGLSALPGHSYLKRDLSYGVYLIHAPVIVVITVYFPSFRVWWLVAVMVLSVTLVFAYLSWTYVEGPAMSHKKIVADWINQRANALWLLRPKAVARDQNLAPHN